jgi:hypothetical protein
MQRTTASIRTVKLENAFGQVNAETVDVHRRPPWSSTASLHLIGAQGGIMMVQTGDVRECVVILAGARSESDVPLIASIGTDVDWIERRACEQAWGNPLGTQLAYSWPAQGVSPVGWRAERNVWKHDAGTSGDVIHL